jgi:hypothetical protein
LDVSIDEINVLHGTRKTTCSHILSEGFLGSPNSTLIRLGDCQCNLLSIDCLEVISCLASEPLAQVFEGIIIRYLIKKTAKYWQWPMTVINESPIGMATQYTTIGVFREWLSSNQLPLGYENYDEAFTNASLYSECQTNDVYGRRCFFRDFGDGEKLGEIEKMAFDRFSNSSHSSLQDDIRKRLQSLRKDPFQVSPMEYLLSFSHLSKVAFNLRMHILALYNRRLKTIGKNVKQSKRLFRVALHIRRGDSCRHELSGYEEHASDIDSPPQISSQRLCYATKVYIRALVRLQMLIPNHQLVVYLATDHSKSLIDELKADHPKLFHSVIWKYLDYSRNLFNYLPPNFEDLDTYVYIEGPENKNKAILGEAAILDIWHLSHGQAFIGHLGSRFGKMGWWQATARYNTFIPYFTVDGHSICCDIDEACGKSSKYVVSMENCLAIFYASSRFHRQVNSSSYWTEGATYRIAAAKEELHFRERRHQPTSE